MFDIVASLVTYKTPLDQLERAVSSFKNTELNTTVIIVDNSQDNEVEEFAKSNGLTYIRNIKNIGFGPGHNRAIFESEIMGKYHVVLNPDTFTKPGALKKLYDFMEKHRDVPLCAPLILNADESIQYVHKRLPTFTSLFLRRFVPKFLVKFIRSYIDLTELRDFDFSVPLVVHGLSGCFMFFRRESLVKLKGFDERFFLYMEDVDLCRRASDLGPTVLFPFAQINHLWTKGSYKSLNLTLRHIQSSLKYFLKWGPGKEDEVSIFKLN